MQKWDSKNQAIENQLLLCGAIHQRSREDHRSDICLTD